jgi:hypothetical protein
MCAIRCVIWVPLILRAAEAGTLDLKGAVLTNNFICGGKARCTEQRGNSVAPCPNQEPHLPAFGGVAFPWGSEFGEKDSGQEKWVNRRSHLGRLLL